MFQGNIDLAVGCHQSCLCPEALQITHAPFSLRHMIGKEQRKQDLVMKVMKMWEELITSCRCREQRGSGDLGPQMSC